MTYWYRFGMNFPLNSTSSMSRLLFVNHNKDLDVRSVMKADNYEIRGAFFLDGLLCPCKASALSKSITLGELNQLVQTILIYTTEFSKMANTKYLTSRLAHMGIKLHVFHALVSFLLHCNSLLLSKSIILKATFNALLSRRHDYRQAVTRLIKNYCSCDYADELDGLSVDEGKLIFCYLLGRGIPIPSNEAYDALYRDLSSMYFKSPVNGSQICPPLIKKQVYRSIMGSITAVKAPSISFDFNK